MILWYRRDGQPYRDPVPETGSPAWVKMIQEVEADLRDPATKRVGETTLPNGLWVSTVWLGINQRFGDGPPLIFETTVFKHPLSESRAPDDGRDRDSESYATLEEALNGHARMVQKWRDWTP